MDYYYDPKVAAELAAYVNYICPVAGRAGRDGRRSTRSWPTNPLIFPDAAMLGKAKVFMALTEAAGEVVRAEVPAGHRGVIDGASTNGR